MIKSLLFDLGGVLVGLDKGRSIKCQSMVTGLSCAELEKLLFEDGLVSLHETGKLKTSDFVKEVRKVAVNEFSDEEYIVAACDMFSKKERMPKVLGLAKSKGYRLVLVSNTNEVHIEHIWENYSCLEYFDELILSHEIGVAKPNREFYEAASKASKCEVDECIFVDDLVENIEAARKFGFHGIVYKETPLFLEELKGHGVLLTL